MSGNNWGNYLLQQMGVKNEQKNVRQKIRDVQCREFLETIAGPVSYSSHSKDQSQLKLEDLSSIPTLGWLEFDFIKRPDSFSHSTPFIYFLSYYPQVTHTFGNTDVMVNLLYQLDRTTRCPDI